MTREFDESLLEKLVCPLTRTPLAYDLACQELVSEAAGIAYPIRGGTAILLVEAARPLDREPAQK